MTSRRFPTIDAKVTVNGDNSMAGIEFAHSYQTKVA
jgi:hypothetical protein